MIDTHAHLDDKKLDSKKIIENMKDNNLSAIVTVGTNLNSCKNVLKIVKNNKNVYAILGFHPEYADEISKNELNELDKMCEENKVVALGEIGLDYHYGKKNIELQKDLFIKQIELAHKHSLPIVLHIRDAIGDALEILRKYKDIIKQGGIAHCFTGSSEVVVELQKLGFYISISGNITYKNTKRDFLRSIMLDRILVETDCPYLSPEPVRNSVNEPKNCIITAKCVAQELEIPFEKFEKMEEDNAKKILYKMR